ncbi:MAG TPA: polysaccharide biosynthesis/export family protein [Paludibacteraceae bacterium]|nr:polysaccharide biosynthesis/export family protein [Paludibacteraceae bacterium]
MTHKKTFLYLLIAIPFLLGSCAMNKKIPYFTGLESTDSVVGVSQHEARIFPDDMLSITVSGIDPEAVAPFNLPVVAYLSPNSDKLYQTPTFQPYLVDVNGFINFPVLGKVKIGGLKKSEALTHLKSLLDVYLKDPIITMQFMNYKITVLGEVARPGSYTINNERITLMEALGLGGDMTVFGRRDNVLLIRENSGGSKAFVRIDLNSTDLLSSPYYYLQQNDVLYVEPNKTRLSSAASVNVSLYLSALSTLASMVTVIVALVNK